MTSLNSLKNRIRGWLPKEPSFPSNKAQTLGVNQETKKPTKAKSFITVFATAFISVLIALSILQVVGLGSFAPFAAGAAGALASAVSSVWVFRKSIAVKT